MTIEASNMAATVVICARRVCIFSAIFYGALGLRSGGQLLTLKISRMFDALQIRIPAVFENRQLLSGAVSGLGCFAALPTAADHRFSAKTS